MTDDGGVLGNLPSSRPGRRSAKRDSAAKAAAKAEASGRPAADPPRTAKAARTSPKPGRAAAGKASPKARPRGRTTAVKGAGSGDRVDVDPDMRGKRRHDPVSAPETSGQAVGAVVRGAAGVAVTGVRVAGAVTQELLRRLPRP